MSSLRPEEAIVDAALAKPRSERAAFLKQACAGDTELRQLAEALLHAHYQAAAPNQTAIRVPPGGTMQVSLPVAEKPGDRIGRYKILQQIGEGGCGVVYMAEQEEPVHRRVAIKVIKLGMDTKHVIARFEAERQALAMMDHVNIARVLDAGATETGRPYFVMELVRGVKITEYCDQNNLQTTNRLDLFMQVCRAIQHAHQKGIIHRDIKPSNILITLHDGVPVPKVIDFGIAKAIEQRLTDKTLFTALEQFIGTPAYMSPEQAEMSGLDIDTRSDIYSLGVLLYELLTGKAPFEAKDLAAAGLNEMRRIIRERDPVLPSNRISTLDAAEKTTVARRRQVEPPKLIHLVRGDLDWIVMKCLEKDRTRRYETTNGLAMDIQRHLDNEPVVARPVSAAYRFRKLVRRNKLAFAAAGAVSGALIIGLGLSTWLFLKERAARERTSEAESDAQAVLDFLQNKVLAAARPEGQDGGLGREVTLRRAVEAAEPQIAVLFTNRPTVEFQIRGTIGNSYLYLGDYPKAIQQFERALDLAKATFGLQHPDTLNAMTDLAGGYYSAGRTTEAIALHEQARSLGKTKQGAEHTDSARDMNNTALSYLAAGRIPEAVTLLEKTVPLMKAGYGPLHPDTLTCMSALAGAYFEAGRLSDAVPLWEEVMKIRKATLSPEHPDLLESMHNLGGAYQEIGRYAEAVQINEQTLKLMRIKLGSDHPQTLNGMNSLAVTYGLVGRTPEAVKLLQEVFEVTNALLGPRHQATIVAMHNLARVRQEDNQLPEALKLLEEASSLAKTNLGPDHPMTLRTMTSLGGVYRLVGRVEESVKLQEETLKLSKAKLGPDHPLTLSCMNNLSVAYGTAGRVPEAVEALEEAMSIQKTKHPGHPQTLISINNLAKAYIWAKRFGEAQTILQSSLVIQRKGLSATNALASQREMLSETLALYGESLLRQDKPVEAEQALHEVVGTIDEKQSGPSGMWTAKSLLGWSLLAQKKYAEAEPLLLAGYEGLKQADAKSPATGKPLFAETGDHLVRLYEAWGKPEKAAEWRAKLEATAGSGNTLPATDSPKSNPPP